MMERAHKLINEFLGREKDRVKKAGSFLVSLVGANSLSVTALKPDGQPAGSESITPEDLDFIKLEGKMHPTMRTKLIRLVFKLPQKKE